MCCHLHRPWFLLGHIHPPIHSIALSSKFYFTSRVIGIEESCAILGSVALPIHSRPIKMVPPLTEKGPPNTPRGSNRTRQVPLPKLTFWPPVPAQFTMLHLSKNTYRHADRRQAGKRAGRQTGRQACRRTYKTVNKQIHKQIDRLTGMQTGRQQTQTPKMSLCEKVLVCKWWWQYILTVALTFNNKKSSEVPAVIGMP